jgi:hypothetical protein
MRVLLYKVDLQRYSLHPPLFRQSLAVLLPALPNRSLYVSEQKRVALHLFPCSTQTRFRIDRLDTHQTHKPFDPFVIDLIALHA